MAAQKRAPGERRAQGKCSKAVCYFLAAMLCVVFAFVFVRYLTAMNMIMAASIPAQQIAFVHTEFKPSFSSRKYIMARGAMTDRMLSKAQ
ncbi:hypothetical protein ACFQI7_14725 [Paenibacillus allorhizosphaerae]|uniref:hypothetical protein n=1 Tax=Paenibacillus allorhizosphaerae TaxID=2849866 RepID=UPI001C403D83|nr:hypothetical protein [Paenibacillus allorhizosphaerae]